MEQDRFILIPTILLVFWRPVDSARPNIPALPARVLCVLRPLFYALCFFANKLILPVRLILSCLTCQKHAGYA